MCNLDVAAQFTELADLLELKGENPFKVRAYRRAAAIIQTLNVDLTQLVEENRLQHLEGIGTTLAGKIVEYLNTGKLGTLERLRAEVPHSLLEVTVVPGIGPKLALRLFQELGVKDIESLREAVQSERLRTLKGLGEKTETNIRAGLLEIERNMGRIPLYEALPLAHELANQLAKLPGVTHTAVAGSIRRMRDTVSDADIVIATQNTDVVTQFLTQQTLVKRVLAQGSTKVSILLHSGLQVDVRMVAEAEFPSALHHFTGSKQHHEALRHLALGKGLSINEYGILDKSTGNRLQPESEAALYAALGLPYIAPELRECTGEIQAAQEHRLPHLVTTAHIKGDLHVHSNWSDGIASLGEIAQEARRRGLEYVAICDHSRSLAIAGGLTIEQLAEREREIVWVNEHEDGAVLLSGIEVDILADGSLDFPNEVLAQHDVVVASIHSGFRQNKEQIMQRLEQAMRNPYVHIIGHPTGRLIGRRAGYDIDINTVVNLAKATGTALEINASPNRLDLSDVYARTANEQGVMIAINTDAHDLSELDYLLYGVGVARRAWLEPASIVNCHPLAQLRTFLMQKRSHQ